MPAAPAGLQRGLAGVEEEFQTAVMTATKELKFTATPDKGDVSAILMLPDGATHLLVLGHGASTNMRHATLQAIADAMAEQRIATFRYNFPYSENGKARNSTATCVETIRNAIRAAHK